MGSPLSPVLTNMEYLKNGIRIYTTKVIIVA